MISFDVMVCMSDLLLENKSVESRKDRGEDCLGILSLKPDFGSTECCPAVGRRPHTVVLSLPFGYAQCFQQHSILLAWHSTNSQWYRVSEKIVTVKLMPS